MQLIKDLELNPIEGSLSELRNLNKPFINVFVFDKEGNKCIVKALLDTGAPVSFISKYLIDSCDLICKDENAIYPTHFDVTNKGQYEASILFDKSQNKPINLLFGKFDDKNEGLHMIIGTDILANFEFIYNKPKGQFSLILPSK